MNYYYKFPLDKSTIQKITSLGLEDWDIIISNLLLGKSIDYNIYFSQRDAEIRLNELYDILCTIEAPQKSLFQVSVVNKLISLYGISSELEKIFILINVIDYIKPSGQFLKLLDLIANSTYDQMIRSDSKNHFSPQCTLANAIMRFDVDNKLFKHLGSLQHSKQFPEYYQLMIRYIYKYCGQVEFDEFLNNSITFFDDPEIVDYTLLGLEEYLYYRNSCELLYYWVTNNFEFLLNLNENLFKSLLKRIVNKHFLSTNSKKNILFKCCTLLLKCFVDPNSIKLSTLKNVLEVNDHSIRNKNELLYLIGLYCPIEIVEPNNKLTMVDQNPILIESKYNDLLNYLKSGIYRKKLLEARSLNVNSEEYFEIPDDVLQQDLNK